MFQASMIRCSVKLKVGEVAKNVQEVVEARARKMLEANCSYVGYTKPGSLRLIQMGPGVLTGIDMGRHFNFQCTFAGEVCNPPPGTRLKSYVRSVNRFGALVEAGYLDPVGTLVPVLELVVVRDPTIARNEVDIDDIAVGEEVGVEVLGRRFELRDTRITGFARTVLDVNDDGTGADVSRDNASDTLPPSPDEDDVTDDDIGSDDNDSGSSMADSSGNDDLESFAGEDEALVDDAETDNDSDGDQDSIGEGDRA